MNLSRFKLPVKQVAGVANAQSPEVRSRRHTLLDRELAKSQTPLDLIDPTGAAIGDLLVFDGQLYVPATTLIQLVVTGQLTAASFTAAGTVSLQGGSFGAFATPPTTQPTITGSRAGNAAVASLLTGLAALGWLIDSTTA
jgi:hypothetical protein